MTLHKKLYHDRIDEFLNAVAPAWCAMDIRTFAETVNVLSYDPLIAEEWTEHHTMPMLIATKCMPPRELARLLHDNPSAIRCLMYYDIFMAKCARRGVNVYKHIFTFYASILDALCKQDIFAASYTNIIHEEDEIIKLASQTTPAAPDVARSLGRLANACYHLSHGLFSDMNPQLVYDNFGPHYTGAKHLFAQKIFCNLRPVELWAETASLPVAAIKIGAVYNNMTMTVDAVTHAVYDGHQVNDLVGFWCTFDGEPATLEHINSAREKIERAAVSVFKKVLALSIEEKKHLYWRQKAWGYKKLFDFLGFDWEPHALVVRAGKGKPLYTNWNFSENQKHNIEIIKNLLDPRQEISSSSTK